MRQNPKVGKRIEEAPLFRELIILLAIVVMSCATGSRKAALSLFESGIVGKTGSEVTDIIAPYSPPIHV